MPVVPASVATFEDGDLPSSPTNVVLPKPPGVVSEDYLLYVATINFDHSGNPETWSMAGFQLLAARNTPSGQYYPKVAIFGKVAGGSEPSSYTLTRSVGGGNLVASGIRFTGVDPADPIANAPTLGSGPQASGSFGGHTPAAPGYSLWFYANHNYRANRDTNVNWSGGPDAELGEIINLFCFQSLYGNPAVQGQATGTRSISITNWGGNTPSTVTSLVLREASGGEPIEAAVPAVDIATTTPQAVTVDRRVVGRPPQVTVQTTMVDPTVSLTADVLADVPPVDLVVDHPALSPVEIVDVSRVDVVASATAVETARGLAVGPVDIAQSFPVVTELVGNVIPPVDILHTTAMPIELAHRIDGPEPLLAAQVEVLAPTIARVVDVPVVDVPIELPVVLSYSTDFRPVEIPVEVLPVTVAFSTDTTAAQRGLQIAPQNHPARIFAQEILTGRWLHTDLPIADLEITRALSGAQLITGNFPAEIRDLADLGLEAWATWIHVEQDNTIRASGILQPTKVDTGQVLSLEAVGVSAYPHGIPYMGENYQGVQVDPADMVRRIWTHLQSYPDAKLGVEVLGTTPILIGTEPEDVEFETGDGEQVSFTAGPYTLHWYEGTDCGSEIDKLAKDTPFEYTEHEFWNDPVAKDYVRHQILLHYPRAGRRTDLVFAQDENLMAAFGPEENPDTWASQVVVLGKGEGSSTVRGYGGGRTTTRVRRVSMIDDKTVASTSRANALANEDWNRRQAVHDITEITIRAHHINAQLGTFQVGDDGRVIGDVPHMGWVDQYERILSFTWSPEQETVRIQCRRSESFTYGGPEQ